ncbi:hypothetical protein TSUD_331490 [Trifolium subterraneum]|uniref:Reverse transcriptase zinc-binding domain-containing protein n=1 Tax=Trifolium subterraneum TaxID=3900 RepID=A0A2Z6LVD9_TRISU|nr:hypothetical protein TSUD_331490 [Trifolium subterraneum]
MRIRDGVGDLGGGWFGECVTKKVVDGMDTFFWTDPWLGGFTLRESFGRLFDLNEHKSSTVADMCSLGWEAGGGSGYRLMAWQLDPVRGYTVSV